MLRNKRSHLVPSLRGVLLIGLGACILTALLIGTSSIRGQQSINWPPFPESSGSETTLLFPNAVEVGKVDKTHPSKLYLVLIDAKDSLVLTMSRTNGNLAPKLRLLDVNGNELVTQGADLAGKRSTLKFTAEQRGWYFIEAGREKDSMAGEFSLVAAGVTNQVYTLLPVGKPSAGETGGSGQPDQNDKAILRAGNYPLAAGETHLWVALPGANTLRLKLTGTGTANVSASAADGSGAVQQAASGSGDKSASLEYHAQSNGWVSVTASVDTGTAVLAVSAVDTSGTAATLYPGGLTNFITVTPTPTITLTPTLTASPTETETLPTLTPSPTLEPTAVQPCPNSAKPRLKIGGKGRVTPGLPNLINTLPARPSRDPQSHSIGRIPAGGVFNVLDGPVCSNNVTWWKVEYQGAVGWSGEMENYYYWAEPAQ